MIGDGQGPYDAPAGQTTQLKVEILNLGPSDVYLIQGAVYLDPSLNGEWELAHSEALGNFHLTYLSSAIWTFDLAVPSSVQAPNATNGIPQVALRLQITYSTPDGVHQTAGRDFSLNVPGAIVKRTDYLPWIIAAVAAFLIIGVIAYQRRPKRNLAE